MASGSVQEIRSYLKASVTKYFPGYGQFHGVVDRVDTRGKDDKPFHITYDDGDAEWVTMEELKVIGVTKTDATSKAPAKQMKAASTKKRNLQQTQTHADARDADGVVQGSSPKGTLDDRTTGPAAMAAAGSGTPAAKCSKLEDQGILRLDYRSSGSTALPAMATAVTYSGVCNIILYSSSQLHNALDSSSAGTAPDGAQINYRTETEQLLAELERRLATCGSHKDKLVKVAVYLRSMAEGLPGFQEAWNAWVDLGRLPLLLLLEGAGPFGTAGMVLEAVACTSAA